MTDVNNRINFHPFQILPVGEDQVIVQCGIVIDDHYGDIFEVLTYINDPLGIQIYLKDLNNEPGEIIPIPEKLPGTGTEIGTIVKLFIVHEDPTDSESYARIQYVYLGIGGLTENSMGGLVTDLDIGTVTWEGGVPKIDQRLKSDVHCSIPGKKVTYTP